MHVGDKLSRGGLETIENEILFRHDIPFWASWHLMLNYAVAHHTISIGLGKLAKKSRILKNLKTERYFLDN